MAADDYEPLYLRGIARFNEEEFFESHEVWEELWIRERGPSRQYYKGLIQAAVSLHHLGRGNLRGARTLLGRAENCLGAYRPGHLGLDVDAFLAALREYVSGVPATGLDRARIPRIHLQGTADGPSL